MQTPGVGEGHVAILPCGGQDERGHRQGGGAWGLWLLPLLSLVPPD